MKKRIFLYGGLLVLGLAIFISQVFIFEYPDGLLGFFVCLSSIYLILGSIIKLFKTSEKFKQSFLALLDLLFWLP